MSVPIINATLSLMILSFALNACGQGTPTKPNDKTQAANKPTEAEALFAKIKSLAGDWVAAKGEAKGQLQTSIRVIAGGSAVVETEFPGTKMEMITVYHMDGDKLLADHYCMLGNQPRFVVKLDKKDNTIVFEYAGATNLKSKDDPHMHQGRMTIIDQDNIKSVWTMFIKGKAAEHHPFELTRKKK